MSKLRKLLLPLIILICISFAIASCGGDPLEGITTEDIIPETPSAEVSTQIETPDSGFESDTAETEDSVAPESGSEDITSGHAETDQATTEEATTEEITTEEITTGEVTTEEITSDVTTSGSGTTPPSPHAHTYGAWTVLSDPTCTETGLEVRSCACGEKIYRDTRALGHIEGKWAVSAEPKCTVNGTDTLSCSRCDAVLKTAVIPATGHAPKTEAKAPTCTETGEKRTLCNTCGMLLSVETVKANGHSEGRHITLTEPTCTMSGEKIVVCSVCTLTVRRETLSPKGHSPEMSVQNATCVKDGYKKSVCSVCNVLISSETLKALGHTEGRRIHDVKATCTDNGVDIIVCSVCTVSIRSETVLAFGHAEGLWVTSEEESGNGISVRHKNCMRCGIILNTERIKDITLVEAERVAEKVNSVKGDNSFTFAAISDIHASADPLGWQSKNTEKSLDYAIKTLGFINKLASVSAVAMLGDYTASAEGYTVSRIIDDLKYVQEAFADFWDKSIAWIRGNHELNYHAESERPLTNEEIYKYVESNSRGLITDPENPTGGYGYMDFAEQKIRMIFLNTSDVYEEYAFLEGQDAPAAGVGSVQLNWLANTALDLTGKEDPGAWGIIVFSHMPLNYTTEISRILIILEAYKNGESGRIKYKANGADRAVNFSFSGKQRGEIICSIHGHSHNFKTEKISSSSKVEPWLWRLCTPCVNSGRENSSALSENKAFAQKWGEFDENGEPVYYYKAVYDPIKDDYIYDESAGTSYCIITIDRDARTIYAYYVGTGTDRVLTY